jgi:hypothetical protein
LLSEQQIAVLKKKISNNTLDPSPTPTRKAFKSSDTSRSKDFTAETYRATVNQVQSLLSILASIHAGTGTPSSSTDPDLPITQSVPLLLQLLSILVPPNDPGIAHSPASPYQVKVKAHELPNQSNNLSLRLRYELHTKLLNAIVPALAYAALRPLAYVLLRSLLLSEQHVKDVMDPA